MLALNYLPVPSACVLSSVFYTRVLSRFSFWVKVREVTKDAFITIITVKILSLFRLGRRTSQQSKYLAAYLSREVSSWQRDIRRYENNFYYICLQFGKRGYLFTVQWILLNCSRSQDGLLYTTVLVHTVTLYFIAYFSILLPWAVKLCEVPPAKSSLLSHKETVVLLLFVVFLNGIFCSTSLTLHLYKLLNKYLKYFKMLDKLYDNWSNNTLNLRATQGDTLWMRMRGSILAVQCSPRDTIA